MYVGTNEIPTPIYVGLTEYENLKYGSIDYGNPRDLWFMGTC